MEISNFIYSSLKYTFLKGLYNKAVFLALKELSKKNLYCMQPFSLGRVIKMTFLVCFPLPHSSKILLWYFV